MAGLTSVRRALTMAMAVALLAQVTTQGDRVEKVLAFEIDKGLMLEAVVGPVQITTLTVSNLGRGYGRGGLSLRTVSPPSELSTTLRFAFDVNNPGRQEWDITFTIELLDKAGKVIDRSSKTENYENEAAVLRIEHPIIEYALPLISQVRVTLQGRRT